MTNKPILFDDKCHTVEDTFAEVAPDCGDTFCHFAWNKDTARTTQDGCRCTSAKDPMAWSPAEQYAKYLAKEVPKLIAMINKYESDLQNEYEAQAGAGL